MYRRPFYFMMPDKKEFYRSVCGTILSLMVLMIVLSYGSYKIKDLVEFKDYRLLESRVDNYFEDSANFTTNEGFHVAAGIVNTDDEYAVDNIEDPEIGTVKMYIKTWNIHDET